MIDHPHLHCVVPGGGLSEDEVEWVKPKKSKKRKKFFVHVNVISDLFKKKFLFYLDKAYRKGELKFEGKVDYLKDPAEFKKFKTNLYAKKWVTFCKRPFGGPVDVLKYLSRYIHKVAISNHRIIKVKNGRVHFKWKNYRKEGKSEETSLEIFEFIRRFLLHVLPKNFYKIRYYGILASRNRKRKLAICREILEMIVEVIEPDKPEKSFEELFFELTGVEPGICPVCKKGRLVRKIKLKPEYLAPV